MCFFFHGYFWNISYYASITLNLECNSSVMSVVFPTCLKKSIFVLCRWWRDTDMYIRNNWTCKRNYLSLFLGHDSFVTVCRALNCVRGIFSLHSSGEKHWRAPITPRRFSIYMPTQPSKLAVDDNRHRRIIGMSLVMLR